MDLYLRCDSPTEDAVCAAQSELTSPGRLQCDRGNTLTDSKLLTRPKLSTPPSSESSGRGGVFASEAEGADDGLSPAHISCSSTPSTLSGKRITLPMPLCLPQLSNGPTSPFVRAYSPVLSDVGISKEEWLQFIDELNLAMACSPPLYVLDAAGFVIGCLPHWWFTLAGLGIQAAAHVGMVVVSRTLSDRYLQRANTRTFAPRGLRVRICRTPAVYKLLGLSESDRDEHKGRLKAAAQFAESVALRLPVISRVYDRVVPSMTPLSSSSYQFNVDLKEYPNGATQRRLALLEEHALPFSFTDLPPPLMPKTIMQRAQRLSVKFEKWRASSTLKKADWHRELIAISEGYEPTIQVGASLSLKKSEGGWMQSSWKARQARQREKDIQRVKQRAIKGKKSKYLQSRVQIADRLERYATQRLLWVVLLNTEQDGAFCGKEPLHDLVAEEDIPEVAIWSERLREKVEERPEIVVRLKELEEEVEEILLQELQV